jgi:hypothetical protein
MQTTSEKVEIMHKHLANFLILSLNKIIDQKLQAILVNTRHT